MIRPAAPTVPDTHHADAATTLRTLAVLLHAGASPRTAWGHLAEGGDVLASAIVRRAEAGVELTTAIAEQHGPWRDVAAAWEIASIVGAPLAEVLRAFAETLQNAAATADEVRVALAEPAATARLMTWLPGIGLLLGFALGFDTLGVIFGSLAGALCVVLGLGLVVLARRWTKRLVLAAQPRSGTPGLHAELTAVALQGGTSLDRALRLVSEATGVVANDSATERVLALSHAAGVPAVELLRASAMQQRHWARIEGRMRAAALSTRLLVPLGVCTLPAFLLLGIAPLILSVLGGTSITP